MRFTQTFKTFILRCIDFKGRTARWDYAGWLGFVVIGGYVTSLIDRGILRETSRLGAVNFTFAAVVLLPLVAVTVRRLHDTGRSGWWLVLLPGVIGTMTAVSAGTDYVVLPLLAIMAAAGLLLYWLSQRGSPGPNRYGPRPAAAAAMARRAAA